MVVGTMVTRNKIFPNLPILNAKEGFQELLVMGTTKIPPVRKGL